MNIKQTIKEEIYRQKCWKIISEQTEKKFPSGKVKKLLADYKSNQKQLQELNDMIAPILNKISELDASQSKLENEVKQKMKDYNKKEIIISGYIAKLIQSTTTTKPTGSYKSGFEEALTYLNEETKRLVQNFFESTKVAKTITQELFSLKKLPDSIEEGVGDWIIKKMKAIFKKFKLIVVNIMNSFSSVSSAQDKLIKQLK